MPEDKPIIFEYTDLGWVASFEEFLRSFFRLRRRINNNKLWFRGQPVATDRLLPTIGREHEYGRRFKIFSPENERWLLHRFRRRAYPHERRVLKAGEALFLARHYGLPTRLLDWTANALFGLYFACVEKPNASAALWAIRRVRESVTLDAFTLAEIGSEEELFKRYGRDAKRAQRGTVTVEAVKIVDPFYSSPRILAQDGAFTFHSNPWRPLESYADVLFSRENLDICALYRWRIRARKKPDVIAQLSGLGITHRMVFPDLDGIARSIWETEVLWRGTARTLQRRGTPSNKALAADS